jgi:hypothetical protein
MAPSEKECIGLENSGVGHQPAAYRIITSPTLVDHSTLFVGMSGVRRRGSPCTKPNHDADTLAALFVPSLRRRCSERACSSRQPGIELRVGINPFHRKVSDTA